MNTIIRFFDLYSQYRDPRAKAQGVTATHIAGWRQLVIYVSCVVGIIRGLTPPWEPRQAISLSGPSFSTSWSRIIWATVFGFVLTAFLFKVLITPKTPLVIQIGVALAAGFGSAKLVPVALKLLTDGGAAGE